MEIISNMLVNIEQPILQIKCLKRSDFVALADPGIHTVVGNYSKSITECKIGKGWLQ